MTAETLLSAQEIRRRLASIAASDRQARNARQAVGMNTIANRAGVGRQFLYQIMFKQRVPTSATREKLSAALKDINLSAQD